MIRPRGALGKVCAGWNGGRQITSIRGITFLAAAAAAGLFAATAGAACAGDAAPAPGLLSLRRNAVVSVGGEVHTDYVFRRARGRDGVPGDRKGSDISLRQTNLRVQADVHPNVAAFFKIDLSSNPERDDSAAALAEEALLVMKAVGGTGLGFFAGKGKAPYGQDITLGIVQSYEHSANSAESSEGTILLVEPPGDGGASSLPPMRPGQFDRAFLAGASYDWDERWRVEVAAFSPDPDDFDRRLAGDDQDADPGIGAVARVWWMATDELALQASAVWARAGDLADAASRLDVAAGAAGVRSAQALSLGFDWRRGPWRAFGEFQAGRDWNFTDGYSVRTWQLGAARQFGTALRLGGMLETLRIDHGPAAKTVDNYYKLAFNVRYAFPSGVFLLAEYGHEWLRREGEGRAGRARGDFFGMRMGWNF